MISNMNKFLPLVFLVCAASAFGLSWIVASADPDTIPWIMFGVFFALLFIFVFSALGLIFYFIRTKFLRKFSSKWYFHSSFKMAFFVAVFLTVVAILAAIKLMTIFNILLLIIAISLFAIWSYLGKK